MGETPDGSPGLPRLENRRYYQTWLRNTADVPAPMGTSDEGPKVTLWAVFRRLTS